LATVTGYYMGMETENSSPDVELEGRRMAVEDDLSGRLGCREV
jgi:hypothetical protein